jgi:hypothetical protein
MLKVEDLRRSREIHGFHGFHGFGRVRIHGNRDKRGDLERDWGIAEVPPSTCFWQ